MSDGTRYYVWPVADERTLTLVMLLLVGLFIGAVFLELYRRRRDRTLRLRAEWRGVKDFCDERELFPEDWKFLHAILVQYAPDHPFAAVTKKSVFDTCLSRYIQAISTTVDGEELESRGVRLRDIRVQLGLDYVPIGRRIQTTRSLQEGQALWGAPAAGASVDWSHFTVTRVNESSFTVAQVDSGTPPQFPADSRVKFRMWREEDARYLFEAPFVGMDAKSKTWTFHHAENLTRNQSRAYFRLRIEQTVNVAVLNATLTDDYEGVMVREAVTELRGRITSLSGGGIAVVFQQPVPKQVLLRIPLSIPSLGGTLKVIVRPIASHQLSGGRSLLRGMFVAMNDETREAIARYVFSKQKLVSSAESEDH